MINYLELAKEQFLNLKEESLDDDRRCIGGYNTQTYKIDGEIFDIKVQGYWEKVIWFEWEVINSKNEVIISGTECFD